MCIDVLYPRDGSSRSWNFRFARTIAAPLLLPCLPPRKSWWKPAGHLPQPQHPRQHRTGLRHGLHRSLAHTLIRVWYLVNMSDVNKLASCSGRRILPKQREIAIRSKSSLMMKQMVIQAPQLLVLHWFACTLTCHGNVSISASCVAMHACVYIQYVYCIED